MNLTAQDEIAEYVEGVRQALAVLPATTREELLEDLPEHLAEVLAEGGGSLVERLGTPQAYAAELSMSAGIAGTLPRPPGSRAPFAHLRASYAEARGRADEARRRTDVRVGPLLGYAKASDFLVLLRPAWWVLRGYLAAMAFAHLFGDNSTRIGLLPRVNNNEVVALLLLAAAVIGSVWLGRRGRPAKATYHRLLQAGTAALVIFAFAGFVETDSQTRDPGYFEADYVSQLETVRDIFVYDAQGRLVEGVQLVDQYGNPIEVGDRKCYDEQTGYSESSAALGYPYCPQQAPFRAGTPDPSDGATTAVPPEPSADAKPQPGDPAESAPAPVIPVPSAKPSASSQTGR